MASHRNTILTELYFQSELRFLSLFGLHMLDNLQWQELVQARRVVCLVLKSAVKLVAELEPLSAAWEWRLPEGVHRTVVVTQRELAEVDKMVHLDPGEAQKVDLVEQVRREGTDSELLLSRVKDVPSYTAFAGILNSGLN